MQEQLAVLAHKNTSLVRQIQQSSIRLNYFTSHSLGWSLFLFCTMLVFFSPLVLNCVNILTRVIPYIFEDPDWRGFFWSTVPGEVVSWNKPYHKAQVLLAQCFAFDPVCFLSYNFTSVA